MRLTYKRSYPLALRAEAQSKMVLAEWLAKSFFILLLPAWPTLASSTAVADSGELADVSSPAWQRLHRRSENVGGRRDSPLDTPFDLDPERQKLAGVYEKMGRLVAACVCRKARDVRAPQSEHPSYMPFSFS